MDQYEDLGMIWLNQHRKSLAPKTTGRRLSSLRAFAKWAGYPGVLIEYVAPKPARAMPHPIPEGIEGVRRMIDAARVYEHKALVALCGLTGCRIGEALTVAPIHFNFQEMTLTIHGKGDKFRVVPVSSSAWQAMQHTVLNIAVLDMTAPVIPYQDRFARKIITDLGKRAGLKRRISSHDLRATFATAAYDRTLDIRVVQELLGHAQVTTTEIYTGVRLESMRNAVEL